MRIRFEAYACEQRGLDRREDLDVDGVAAVEADRSVDLQDEPAVARHRQQIDADQIAADRFRRQRELAGVGRRYDGHAPAPERHVGAPLAGRRLTHDGADDGAACDDDPQIETDRRDEALGDATRSVEPDAQARGSESKRQPATESQRATSRVGGGDLVVRGRERVAAVEHRDAAAFETACAGVSTGPSRTLVGVARLATTANVLILTG